MIMRKLLSVVILIATVTSAYAIKPEDPGLAEDGNSGYPVLEKYGFKLSKKDSNDIQGTVVDFIASIQAREYKRTRKILSKEGNEALDMFLSVKGSTLDEAFSIPQYYFLTKLKLANLKFNKTDVIATKRGPTIVQSVRYSYKGKKFASIFEIGIENKEWKVYGVLTVTLGNNPTIVGKRYYDKLNNRRIQN